jgi:hypothetical protein
LDLYWWGSEDKEYVPATAKEYGLVLDLAGNQFQEDLKSHIVFKVEDRENDRVVTRSFRDDFRSESFSRDRTAVCY